MAPRKLPISSGFAGLTASRALLARLAPVER